MAKQMLEVDVPDGWELVRFGRPKVGEHYVSDNAPHDCVHKCRPGDIDGQRRLIVRPAWQWPDFLKAPWICQSPQGHWFACSLEPFPNGGEFWYFDGSTRIAELMEYFAFTPPPCDDWRTSKRRNPNL